MGNRLDSVMFDLSGIFSRRNGAHEAAARTAGNQLVARGYLHVNGPIRLPTVCQAAERAHPG
jgi:hypothetical protein